jgi:hypothetical protein
MTNETLKVAIVLLFAAILILPAIGFSLNILKSPIQFSIKATKLHPHYSPLLLNQEGGCSTQPGCITLPYHPLNPTGWEDEVYVPGCYTIPHTPCCNTAK